jgi:hypothetical protein
MTYAGGKTKRKLQCLDWGDAYNILSHYGDGQDIP